MASDISSGGSSKFLAARKLFRVNSSNVKEEVEVFVEDEVDTVFWRHFFPVMKIIEYLGLKF